MAVEQRWALSKKAILMGAVEELTVVVVEAADSALFVCTFAQSVSWAEGTVSIS